MEDYKSRLARYGVKSPNRHTLDTSKVNAYAEEYKPDKKSHKNRRSPSRTLEKVDTLRPRTPSSERKARKAEKDKQQGKLKSLERRLGKKIAREVKAPTPEPSPKKKSRGNRQ